MRRLVPLLSLLACAPEPEPEADPGPGADCSGWAWYADDDGDGFGDPATSITGCEPPDEGDWVPNAGDCDDQRRFDYPGAPERCDGWDQDCDGTVDEAPASGLWYADADGDGQGDPASPSRACEAPTGAVWNAYDCDDTRADVFLGALEACDGVDQDCDGSTDETAGWADADGDGYGDPATRRSVCDLGAPWAVASTDCDDARADVFPGAEEVCDGVDQDCDGEADQRDGYFGDADGDGFGDASAPASACYATAAVPDDSDCDDADPDVFPGAAEVCDGVDQDCDGDVDGDSTQYADADGDGFGDASVPGSACDPEGAVADSTDCDDADPDVFPGATEVCDGVDEDCDGYVDDDATDGEVWFEDCDGDGYGGCATRACFGEEPSWQCDPWSWGYCGYAPLGGDCNDVDAWNNPGMREFCDGSDNDCDGAVDEEGAYSSIFTYGVDDDGDGYCATGSTMATCSPPSGYVRCTGWPQDCDDADPSRPTWGETCDGVDEDCNGIVDDYASGAALWYVDADGDGYGDPSATVWGCGTPSGATSDATDCDDARADVFPGAAETCDGADEDCDGAIDDGATSTTPWYADADGDGFGAGAAIGTGCAGPAGASAEATDCDDAAATVFPGAPELCDGVPNDCVGTAWTSAAEDGLAARERADGTWEDVTAGLAFGFLDDPPAGSTTWLCAGTWEGTFAITEDDATIEGRAGPDETTLAPTGAPGIAVSGASGVTIRGLTVAGGAATAGAAGLDASYADGLLVEDCAFVGLIAARATAGAVVAYAPGTFRRVTFADNLSWRDGAAGLYVLGADVVVEDGVFEGNRTSAGSGAALRLDGATAAVSGTTFVDNVAGEGGGAVFLEDSTLDLWGSALTGNTASSYGGALALLGASAVTCAASAFDGNAASEGGAVALPAGSTGSFSAVGCAFGATTANTPEDVAVGATWRWTAGATTTFVCDGAVGDCR